MSWFVKPRLGNYKERNACHYHNFFACVIMLDCMTIDIPKLTQLRDMMEFETVIRKGSPCSKSMFTWFYSMSDTDDVLFNGK